MIELQVTEAELAQLLAAVRAQTKTFALQAQSETHPDRWGVLNAWRAEHHELGSKLIAVSMEAMANARPDREATR